MGLQRAALEIVLSNFEEDLAVDFFGSMINITELHMALRIDGARARLRRIGVKFTAVLEAKAAAWHPLATRRGRLNDELRTRDEHLAEFLTSDLNDPLNEYYVDYDGNYELRHRTTVELQAESDEIYKEIQTLADILDFDNDGGYDSEDPDLADGSMVLARCRVWAGL